MLFKIFLFSKGKASVDQYKVEELNIPDKNLPVYSILVPLYKEKEVVPQLINAIRKLDYPKSKLDVKLIVEHDDVETIVAIKNLRCERYFHIIEVPFSEPRTKPKACNYAMNFVLGEYVTIYDAEDIPDSQQLKKVINIFCQSDHKTICVQAKLNYYNWSANWLTKLFAIEYSVWFDVVMYGLSGLKMPIPLGGTSNHFNVHKLKQIGCWDPYNVTEDADLGIRIAANNYEIKLVDSTTQEGAPTKFINWYKQRSRWLKGYMQTYLVHMRQPNKLIKNIGIQGFLGFQLFIGLPIIIYLISWPLIIVSIISSVFNIVEFPISLLYIAWVNLFAGYIMMLSMAMKARKYRKFSKITTMTLIYPLFYAVILPLVSIRSLYQLITTPHYWEKTSHAESLRHNDI
jgi:cellulose synthase/poly-beta-1,6-N-acetylglucosamine synthase-like glycosyltransferase